MIIYWKNLFNRCIEVHQNITTKNESNIHYEYIKELTINLHSNFQKLKQTNDELEKLVEQRATKLQILNDKFFLDIHSYSGSILMLVRKNTEEIINVNNSFYRILEYSKQDVLGKVNSMIWVNKQDPIKIKNLLQDTKIIKQQIFQLRTKFGKVKSFLLSAEEIDIDGQTFIFYMASDITNIIKNSCFMSYRCLNDQDWTMKYISCDCEKLTGYKIKDIVDNKQLAFADIVHQDDYDFVLDTIQKALEEQRAYEILYRIKTKAEEIKWVWERGQGIFSYNGQSLVLEGLIEDVNSFKKIEDKFIQRRDDLRKQIQQTIQELRDTNSGLKLAQEIPVLLDALNVETIADITALTKLVTPEIDNNIEPELYLAIIALGKVVVTIKLYEKMIESPMESKILFTAKQELQAVAQQVNNLPASLQVLMSQIIIRWESILNS